MTSRDHVAHVLAHPFLALGLLLFSSISVQAQKVTATIPVGENSIAIAVNPVTNKIYVANCVGGRSSRSTGTEGTVTVIDGVANTATSIAVGICPTAVAVHEGTNKIYVANYGHFSLYCRNDYGSVTVIDGVTNSTDTISGPNEKYPVALAVNPANNVTYVANSFSYDVEIHGASSPIDTVPVRFPYGLAVNQVTNKIYVTSFNSFAYGPDQSVTVIDGTNGTSAKLTFTDPKAADPIAVAVNAFTNKIYVANNGYSTKGSVTVIDGANNSTKNIADPNIINPHAVVVNPASDKIYVADSNGGVTVIAGSTNHLSTVTDPKAGTVCNSFRTASMAVARMRLGSRRRR